MILFTTANDQENEEISPAADPGTEEELALKEEYRRFGLENENEASMDDIADMLSTFSDGEGEDGQRTGDAKRSDMAKKKRWIPILAVCTVIGIAVYLLVLKPMLAKVTQEEAPPPINTWLSQQLEAGAITEPEYTDLLNKGKCEVLGTNNRILMFNHVQKADIQSVDVTNEYGSYTFYRDSSDNFAIRGAETVSYSQERLASLVVSAGYTISMTRVTEICEDMSEYGLSPEDAPASYTLTTTRGVTHTVYIGDKIPTGGGYYCSYEDRPAVYVLDSTIASTLLADVRDMMQAIIVYPISQNNYYTITNFDIIKNGEPFLHVDYLSDAERVQMETTDVWKMVYPEGGYTPSSDTYEAALYSLVSLTGLRVMEFNVLGGAVDGIPSDEQIKMLIQYDLAEPAVELSFDYPDPENNITVTNKLWFSDDLGDGTCYVYSWLFDIIALVDRSACPYLSCEIIDLVDRPIFQMFITDVARVEISGRGNTDTFTEVDFRLAHGENSALTVTDTFSGKVVNTDNFRNLYREMLGIDIEGYAEDLSTDEEDLISTLRVTTNKGTVKEFKFYAYSTRRCLVTINGKGEFYVLRDKASKLISDVNRLLNDELIDTGARN